MPLFTAPARRLLFSYSAAAALLLGGAGCQNARSAYQFRPAPTVATAPRPPAPARPVPAVTPAPEAVAAAPAPVVRPVVTQPVRQLARRVARAVPLRLDRVLAPSGRPAYAAVARPARHGPGATDGAQATAEVGLGTTALGVLGLIVGPIALIGLLIWGGPVWAVLLGLSALAVLVAYLDPFQ